MRRWGSFIPHERPYEPVWSRFPVRSERRTVTYIDCTLQDRWFVGLGMDEAVLNHFTFSANRDRLLNEMFARSFFA